MAIELRGTPVPQRQRMTRRYSPSGGFIQTHDWASFSESQILQMFNWACGQGIEAEMTSKGGRYELTLTDTRGLTRTDRWECGVSEEQPGLLSNPYLDVNVNGSVVSAWERMVIAAAIDKNISLTEAVENEEVQALYGVIPVALFSARGRRIHELMSKKQTQFQTGRLLLRHTMTVGSRYALNVSDQNENSVYTHAQFLAEVLNPASWILPLPGRLEYKVTRFHNLNMPDPRPYWLYGWLKSVSPETAVANHLVEIQTVFKLDAWNLDVYPVAS